MRGKTVVTAVLLLIAATGAFADCSVGPRVVIETPRAVGADATRTTDVLAATKMFGDTATVLRTVMPVERDGQREYARVDVVIWVWYSASGCATPPESAAGWKIEKFNTMTAAAAAYESLSRQTQSARLVSSIWGDALRSPYTPGTGTGGTLGGVASSAISIGPEVAWLIWYDETAATTDSSPAKASTNRQRSAGR